jgi:hypothetical protein
VKENTSGQMVAFMKALGKTTKWKVQVPSNGLTRENTKASMLTTKRRVTVFSTGPMVASTMDSGKMENNTAAESTPTIRELLEKENGSKESAPNGLKNQKELMLVTTDKNNNALLENLSTCNFFNAIFVLSLDS